jgi:hypothetical protein
VFGAVIFEWLEDVRGVLGFEFGLDGLVLGFDLGHGPRLGLDDLFLVDLGKIVDREGPGVVVQVERQLRVSGVGLGPPSVGCTDRQRTGVLLDDVDVEVVGFGLHGGGGQHDGPTRRRVVVRVLVVVEVVVQVVFGRAPVRVAVVACGGTAAAEQPRRASGIQHACRQGDVAGATYGVPLADQHGNEHEEPEHDE